MRCVNCYDLFFFFNDTATTEIYTLSLHDVLPISRCTIKSRISSERSRRYWRKLDLLTRSSSSMTPRQMAADRKSTRLNSSHANISYAVFCLKKKTLADVAANIDSHI